MASTVSDLRGLPGDPGLWRRCPARAGSRVWRETSTPPVLGKETASRRNHSCVPACILFPALLII